MSTEPSNISSKLEQLRINFFSGLPGRLNKIVHTRKMLLTAADFPQQLESLIIALHSLAGTSATYGYMDISRHAKEAERYLREHEPDAINDEVLRGLDVYIDTLYRDVEENNDEQLARQKSQQISTQLNVHHPVTNVSIYCADDDPAALQEISELLVSSGYQVTSYSQLDKLQDALNARLPTLLIINISMQGERFTGADFVQQLREQTGIELPVIFLSNTGELEYRHHSQRAGGSFFLTKPLDIPELIHSIERVVSYTFQDPYRVLIVDDDPEHASYTAHILQQTGITTEIILSPEAALDTINRFKPEVILLDMFMPVYNGLDLAAMIRMDPKQQFTSIVFLSSDTDADRQLQALKLGADDFLVKPVNPRLLLQSVQIRAQRARSFASAFKELGQVVNELEHFKMALDQHAIVSVADAAGKITYANQKFCDISGYAHEELIGQSHSLLNSGFHPAEFFTHMWQTIASGETWQGDIKNRTKSGGEYWVASTISPIIGESGRPEEYISIRTDITHQLEISESLRISEERLRRSQEAARIGNWDWNIKTGNLYWSEQIGPLFGYDEIIETTYDNFLSAVHPEDRDLVINAINNCIEKGADYDIEHRIILTDGKVRWLSEKGDVIRDNNNQPSHMLGVVQDITRRKSAERLLDLLHYATSTAISSEEYTRVFDIMLSGLLELTDSKYGFIGEVLKSEQGQYYLKSHSITNIAWDEESRAFYAENAPDGMEFHNLDTLFGEVIKSGNTVISNDPENDPRSRGIPEGHPPLQAFLGVPLFYGNEMVGMYGIANRPEGYDKQIIDFLQPFSTTCSSLFHALWLNRERIHDHEELREAKEMAEYASRSKSDFLSRMSHELRTPLNAILGFGQLLESDSAAPLSKTQNSSVEQILTAGWHLLELINEVLDLSKIESGKFTISMETVNASEVVEECIKLTQPLAEQNQVRVVNRFQGANVFIRVDRIRFKQVYLNLLSNAIKYNHIGGTVYLNRKNTDDGRTEFSIQDTGIGIAKERLPELFEPFNRLGAERTATEGTGIGLVIAKRLTEIMDGQIKVQSEIDVGTTFQVYFINSSSTDYSSPEEHEEVKIIQTKKATADSNFRILYIEDNPANLKLVSNILNRIPNVELSSETDGIQGLERARELKPDLVLLDIHLPGMSGTEICSLLNQDPSTKHIPRIAISASAMPTDIETAMLSGFHDYLTKPIDVNKFLNLIDDYKNQQPGKH